MKNYKIFALIAVFGISSIFYTNNAQNKFRFEKEPYTLNLKLQKIVLKEKINFNETFSESNFANELITGKINLYNKTKLELEEFKATAARYYSYVLRPDIVSKE